MNIDTGETMAVEAVDLLRLAAAGHEVIEPQPGQRVVLLPDAVYKAEQARIAAQGKARRRAARKQATASRRAQRGK